MVVFQVPLPEAFTQHLAAEANMVLIVNLQVSKQKWGQGTHQHSQHLLLFFWSSEIATLYELQQHPVQKQS